MSTETLRRSAAQIVVSEEFRRRVLRHRGCTSRLGASGWLNDADLDDAIGDFAENQLRYAKSEDIGDLVGLFCHFLGQRALRAKNHLGCKGESGAAWQYKHVELHPDTAYVAPPGPLEDIERFNTLHDLADAQDFVNPQGRYPARQAVLATLAQHHHEFKNCADFSRRFGVSRKSLGEVLNLLDKFNAQRAEAAKARRQGA